MKEKWIEFHGALFTQKELDLGRKRYLNLKEDSKLVCCNCEKEYVDSDAEDFEKFCCATCEGEYGTDIDSDEKAEYFEAKAEDLALDLALEDKREKEGDLND